MNVGTTLKSVLSNTWGIPTCGSCHETARRMDELGVAGCREHVDELAEQLHQNAQSQKWTSLTGAAVKFVDATTHAVAGNALYKRLILDVCDYVERTYEPCGHRGDRCGNAPWNRQLERYRCLCQNVHERFCIVSPMSAVDVRKAPADDVAVCSLCQFNTRQE